MTNHKMLIYVMYVHYLVMYVHYLAIYVHYLVMYVHYLLMYVHYLLMYVHYLLMYVHDLQGQYRIVVIRTKKHFMKCPMHFPSYEGRPHGCVLYRIVQRFSPCRLLFNAT